MTALDPGAPATAAPPAPAGVEANGLNVIAESERKGRARDLFWPWFGANVSVLGLSYGSFILGFGISFWQATVVAVIGITISFALCGVVALAGRRGSAPTMLLSRAAFGVHGNRLAALISWVLLVGWETALTSLAVLATNTVFTELGLDLGPLTKIVALIVVAALTVGAGVIGFDAIMRLQKWITWITGVLTVVSKLFHIVAPPTSATFSTTSGYFGRAMSSKRVMTYATAYVSRYSRSSSSFGFL